MNMFKPIAFLGVLLFLIMPLQEWAFAQEFAYKYELKHTETSTDIQEKPYQSEFFRVRGIPKVTVHTTTGNIEVFRNPDIDGVMVELYLERSFSLWSGKRNLDNYRIILQQQGDHIIASVEDKKSGQVPSSSDIKFHFVVQTPQKVSANLRTFNGDIVLQDVDGHHFVQNQSGNVSINDASGEISVVSTLGDIDLSNLSGKVQAKTVNGNVNIISSSGEIRVRSVTGDVIASDHTGTLVSATTSGNIFADFREMSKGVYLETLSGDIDLQLPTTIGYNIEGSAMSYDLEGLSAASISQRQQNHRQLSVVIRDGGLPVHVTTMSGRVRVSESQ